MYADFGLTLGPTITIPTDVPPVDPSHYHRLLDAYLWLSLKFPASFAEPERAAGFQLKSSQYISDALLSLPPPEKKRRPTARKDRRRDQAGDQGAPVAAAAR